MTQQDDLFGVRHRADDHQASLPYDHKGSAIPSEVCRLFEKLALDIATGNSQRGPFKKYSADAILHRIRWHFQIEKGDRAFKCNNNWTSILARWFLDKHPEHEGFFELRERVDDGYDVDAL